MSSSLDLNANEFEDKVLKSTIPVMLDFWAEWCGPCKAITPFVEQLAEEYAGKVQIFKINVDNEPTLAAQFNVMSIPTLIIVKQGQETDRMVGAGSKAALASFLDRNL